MVAGSSARSPTFSALRPRAIAAEGPMCQRSPGERPVFGVLPLLYRCLSESSRVTWIVRI
jgi:hypothetical protein